MLDTSKLSELSHKHALEYLNKQGYDVSESEPRPSGETYIEAEKFKKKSIFAVKAIARGENGL